MPEMITFTVTGDRDPGSIAEFVRKHEIAEATEATGKRGYVKVPCGSCNACCREPAMPVSLTTEEAGRLRSHRVDQQFAHDGWAIDRDPATGACVYLIEDRCSIYAERPVACRHYDCRLHRLGTALPYDQSVVHEAVASWAPFKPKNRTERVLLVRFILAAAQIDPGEPRALDRDRIAKVADFIVSVLELTATPADQYEYRTMKFVEMVPGRGLGRHDHEQA